MAHDAGSQPAEVPVSSAQPTSEEVRAQLARIVASPDFDVPERSRGFLRYVVEETLAGRGERIKGYTVAVEVFGRDAAVDTNVDPVVRIEAGRLRRALERYYLMAGEAEPVLISIPKGGYSAARWGGRRIGASGSRAWRAPAGAAGVAAASSRRRVPGLAGPAAACRGKGRSRRPLLYQSSGLRPDGTGRLRSGCRGRARPR